MNNRKASNLLFEYIKLVLKRSFTSIFLLADALGLLILVLSFKLETLPWYLSLSIFIFVFIASGYSVWHDQVIEKQKIQRRLNSIAEQIPEYTIQLSDIQQFDISEIINEVNNDIKNLQEKIKLKRKQEEERANGIPASSILSAATVSSLASSMNQMSNLFGNYRESDEKKVERLQRHLKALAKYQDNLKYIYRTAWNIEGTRADKNIEVEMTAGNTVAFALEDDYAISNIPRTQEPADPTMLGYMHPSSFTPNIVSSIYHSNYVNKDKTVAASEIKTLNAKRPMSIFDDELYLITKDEKLSIQFTIHSQKRVEPQVIDFPINLTGINIEQVSNK